MHFRHISAKIQLKNLKQHFDWGGGGDKKEKIWDVFLVTFFGDVMEITSQKS